VLYDGEAVYDCVARSEKREQDGNFILPKLHLSTTGLRDFPSIVNGGLSGVEPPVGGL
jgi:hypothetical protein